MSDTAPSVSAVLAGEVNGAARRRRIIWAIIGAAIVLAIVGGWFWWSASQRGAVARYRTEATATTDIVVTIVATGALGPTGQVDVSSALTGTIVSVEAEVNDRIAKGQPLARIDASELEVRMARASAMLAGRRASKLTAEANFADAEMALSRTTQLAQTQSVSNEALELAASAVRRARAGLAMAAAEEKAAEADVQTARMDLEKTCICAPIGGMVLSAGATLGESISAAGLSAPLFTIVEDLSRLNLEADIDEVDIGQVHEGDAATFTVEAWPDRRFAGTIEKLHYAPAASDGVVSYRAELSVDNPALELRPGMTAIADIVVDRAEDVLAVPNAALRFSPGATANGSIFAPVSGIAPEAQAGTVTVWILNNGTPEKVDVTTGLSDGQVTQITGGSLKAGDAVIVGVDAR